MANETATVNLTDNDWTEVADAGEVAIVEPQVQSGAFLVRYAALDPNTELSGHIFHKNQDNISFTVGSANTDKAWVKPLSIGATVPALVTKL